MGVMFANAVAFHGDISQWDVSSVSIMSQMFDGASSFNQTLCWDIFTSSPDTTNIFTGSGGSFLMFPNCRPDFVPTASPSPTLSVLPSASPTSDSPSVAPTSSPSPTLSDSPSVGPTVCINSNVFILTVQFECCSGKFGWQLRDGNNLIVDNPFDTYYDYYDEESVEVVLCLPTACYTLTVMDSFGDGLCCGFGFGSYEATFG